MSGNRKHGFCKSFTMARSIFKTDWFCDGCQKEHRYEVERNGYNGKSWCNRTYWRDVRDAKTGELKI